MFKTVETQNQHKLSDKQNSLRNKIEWLKGKDKKKMNTLILVFALNNLSFDFFKKKGFISRDIVIHIFVGVFHFSHS